jgi:hypothetical protein
MVNDSFLSILEGRESINNTLDGFHIFNEAYNSKLEMTKTKCYQLA